VIEPESSARRYAAAGLASAVAVLTKLPNLYVLAIADGSLLRRLRRSAAVRRGVALYALAFVLPVGIWLGRNELLQGDLLGVGTKVDLLGWRHNPASDWLEHPLFTVHGFTSFGGDLIPRFWRGELVWHRRELAWPPADEIYTATTLVFLALAFAALPRRPRGPARSTELASAAAVVVSVAILVLMSLLFVFPAQGNPSAARPWFYQGRLIDGALLPFAVLYVRGLCVLTSLLPSRARTAVAATLLAALSVLCVGSDVWLALPAFHSPHNFWHLP